MPDSEHKKVVNKIGNNDVAAKDKSAQRGKYKAKLKVDMTFEDFMKHTAQAKKSSK